MAKIIFVAGLHTRAGDKSPEEQADLVRKGYPGVEVILFPYDAPDANVKKEIDRNPGVPILLFSAGCRKAPIVAQRLKDNKQPVSLLYVNEPYTVPFNNGSMNGVFTGIETAIKLGLPSNRGDGKSNIFSGGYIATGSNLPGAIVLPNRRDHWQSVTESAKYIAKIYGSATTAPTQPQAPPTTPQPQLVSQTQQTGTTGSTPSFLGSITSGFQGFLTSAVNLFGENTETSQDTGTTDSPTPELTFITNIVPAKIKASSIRFDVPPQVERQQEIASNFGKFPVIWYNTYQISQRDITFFSLNTSSGFPTLKVIFTDSLNLMKDKAFPVDDTRITLFINTLSDYLKPIHMDFKIIKFNVSGKTYTITGIMDVSPLYTKSFRSMPKMTSFSALKSIAEEVGLGFNTNIDDTNDEMTWINPGERLSDFIDNITDSSYKSDEAYLLSYIDYYYNLNFVELEKELNRSIREELGIANIGVEEIAAIKDKTRIEKLFLTNDNSMRTSVSFIQSYKILNNSTEVSILEGYMTKLNFYDQVKKDFLSFDVDSITSQGDKTIIMKGSPQDETFFNQNVNLVYNGKLDPDNVHINYNYSYYQNLANVVEFEKICLEVLLPNPNYNLMKFQKIALAISNQAPTPSEAPLNNRLSGEWIVLDISFKYSDRMFSQTVKLVKRELELSADELEREGSVKKREKPKRREQVSRDSVRQQPVTTTQDNFQTVQKETAANPASNLDVPVGDSTPPVKKPTKNGLVAKSQYKDKKGQLITSHFFLDTYNGLAGERLKRILTELQQYLRSKGWSDITIVNNGVMRSLEESAATPKKDSGRIAGSFHGAGLAIDVIFKGSPKEKIIYENTGIMGPDYTSRSGKKIKHRSIWENQNIVFEDKDIIIEIWKWVQAQGDLTWGAEWNSKKGGKKTDLSVGHVNGFPLDNGRYDGGIGELHHFEIKRSLHIKYWKLYEKEIKDLGFDIYKISGDDKQYAILYKALLDSAR